MSTKYTLSPKTEIDHVIHDILKHVWRQLRSPEFYGDGVFRADIGDTDNMLDVEITSELIYLDINMPRYNSHGQPIGNGRAVHQHHEHLLADPNCFENVQLTLNNLLRASKKENDQWTRHWNLKR